MATATPTEGDYALWWPLSIRMYACGVWRGFGFNMAYCSDSIRVSRSRFILLISWKRFGFPTRTARST
jgi:hypothetical protein